jgi:putative hemolysin
MDVALLLPDPAERLFAMSEMALTASRKARLQVMVEAGEPARRPPIDLHDHPPSSCRPCRSASPRSACSTASSARPRSRAAGDWLHRAAAAQQRVADLTATALVVVMIITFLTIIFGELVPKRLGQIYPETSRAWWPRR